VHAKGPWTDVADGDAVDKEVMDTVPHWDLTWAKPLTVDNGELSYRCGGDED